MLRSFNLFSLAIVLICSSLFDSQRIFAQSIWLDKGHDKTISLEILKPDFDGDDNTTFATSASFLSGRFRATNNIFLVGEIPFAHLGVDSDFGRDDSENTLGNPYFGIELHGNNSPLYGEIGVRLPLAPDTDENEAAIVGLFTELVDRAEAFISDAIPISGAINYRHKNPTGFVLRLRGGSALWIETGEGDETELFLLYSVQAGYESSKFNS